MAMFIQGTGGMECAMKEVIINNILGSINFYNGTKYDGYWKDDKIIGPGKVLNTK